MSDLAIHTQKQAGWGRLFQSVTVTTGEPVLLHRRRHFRVIISPAYEQLPQGFSSWMEYWEYESGRRTHLCLEKHCNNSGVEVVQVHFADDDSESKLLVPLCEKHRCCGEVVDVSNAFSLVRVK